MKCLIFSFSATGNTARLVSLVSEELERAGHGVEHAPITVAGKPPKNCGRLRSRHRGLSRARDDAAGLRAALPKATAFGAAYGFREPSQGGRPGDRRGRRRPGRGPRRVHHEAQGLRGLHERARGLLGELGPGRRGARQRRGCRREDRARRRAREGNRARSGRGQGRAVPGPRPACGSWGSCSASCSAASAGASWASPS